MEHGTDDGAFGVMGGGWWRDEDRQRFRGHEFRYDVMAKCGPSAEKQKDEHSKLSAVSSKA